MARQVVVVGGGVVGAFAAYHLARGGARVTVVDRAGFGRGCSHANCGYVCPSHVLPLAVPGAVGATLRTLFQTNSPLKVRPATVLANLGWFLGFARRCNERQMLAAGAAIQASKPSKPDSCSVQPGFAQCRSSTARTAPGPSSTSSRSCSS